MKRETLLKIQRELNDMDNCQLGRLGDLPVKFRIEYHGKSDSLGRCMFSLHWMADYHPGHPEGEYRHAERGQFFFCDPHTYGFPRPEET